MVGATSSYAHLVKFSYKRVVGATRCYAHLVKFGYKSVLLHRDLTGTSVNQAPTSWRWCYWRCASSTPCSQEPGVAQCANQGGTDSHCPQTPTPPARMMFDIVATRMNIPRLVEACNPGPLHILSKPVKRNFLTLRLDNPHLLSCSNGNQSEEAADARLSNRRWARDRGGALVCFPAQCSEVSHLSHLSWFLGKISSTLLN